MENRTTLSSVFPLEVQSTLKKLTTQQAVQDSPILVLNSHLDKKRVESLSQESKLIIVGVTKSLARLTPEKRSNYSELDSALRQNPLLELSPDSQINSATQFARSFDSFSPSKLLQNPLIQKFASLRPELSSLLDKAEKVFEEIEKLAQDWHVTEPDTAVTPEEVKTWFSDLIKNSSLILDNLNPDFYMDLLTWLSASFPDLVDKKNMPILDLSILTYPSSTQSYFELTHIKISGWAQLDKDIIVLGKRLGISGDFTQKRFLPRTSVIKSLKPETIEKAVGEISSLFA